MTKQRPKWTTLSQILKVLSITVAMAVGTQTRASEGVLTSSYPALDAAAGAFAEGQLDAAVQRFETLAQDAAAPSFARGLALFGLAEAALARQDPNAAIAV